MSRKRNRTRYKNRTPAPAPAPQQGSPLTKPQAVAQILSALDGYSNAAAFLGEDSPLLASGTFRRSGLTSNTELLTVTYRENWLAKRIIDMPSGRRTPSTISTPSRPSTPSSRNSPTPSATPASTAAPSPSS